MCPDRETLRDVKTMAVWGEGVAGTVSLDIKSIGGTDCGSSNTEHTNAYPVNSFASLVHYLISFVTDFVFDKIFWAEGGLTLWASRDKTGFSGDLVAWVRDGTKLLQRLINQWV